MDLLGEISMESKTALEAAVKDQEEGKAKEREDLQAAGKAAAKA